MWADITNDITDKHIIFAQCYCCGTDLYKSTWFSWLICIDSFFLQNWLNWFSSFPSELVGGWVNSFHKVGDWVNWLWATGIIESIQLIKKKSRKDQGNRISYLPGPKFRPGRAFLRNPDWERWAHAGLGEEITMHYALAAGLRAVLERGWPGLMLGSADFVRWRPALGLGFWRFFLHL